MVTITMEGYAEQFTDLKWEAKGGFIKIWTGETFNNSQNTLEKYCNIQPFFNVYKIGIPKNASVEITYENGNFINQNFIGDLILKLESGDVALNSIHGKIDANLFSGTVSVTAKNLNYKVSTNLGEFSLNGAEVKAVDNGGTYKGTIARGQNWLAIQSVKANIDFNSIQNQ